MRLLPVILLLAGCSPGHLPVQPPSPTDANVIKTVEATQDKIDGKVAAAVTVAKENADKPHVVDSELAVALSMLDKPSDEDVSQARLRSQQARPEDYEAARKFGAKLLASLDDAQKKMEANQKEAKRVSDLKDAKIADLERQLNDSKNLVWTIVAAGLVIIGSVAAAFGVRHAGFILILAGFATGVYSQLLDTKWFVPGVCGIAALAALFAYIHFLRKPEPDSDETKKE
jgi:hypothetical protein